MIIFLYGQNSYLSYQQLNKIKKKHLDANPNAADQIILDAKNTSYNEIVRQVNTLPFLSKSRLVIIKNLLSEGKKELQEKILSDLKKIPQTTILVFYENKSPDKRTKLFKEFKKQIKKNIEFNLLNDVQLKKWLENEFTKNNLIINSDVLEKLIIYVGNDLWRMSNEIKKIALFTLGSRKVELSTINALIRPKINSNIFALVDAVVENNISSAVRELYYLRANSVNEFLIFTMILNQFKNLLMAKELINEGANRFTIQQKLKIHPFVAQKIYFQSKKFDINHLKFIFEKICRYDFLIKSGKIEARLGIDIMIVEICVGEKISGQLVL